VVAISRGAQFRQLRLATAHEYQYLNSPRVG
jgi:hypothetical protein